jgi:hypothetical protein
MTNERDAPGGGGSPPSAESSGRYPAGGSRGGGGEGKPEPIDPGALGDVPARYVEELAEELQVPTDLVVLSALGAMAAVCHERLMVEIRPGHREPCCLYLLGVGESGEGKTPLIRRIRKPVHAIELDRMAEQRPQVQDALAKREALRAALAKAKAKAEGVEEAWKKLEEHTIPPAGEILAPADSTPEAMVQGLVEAGGALAIIEDEPDFLNSGHRYQAQGMPNLGLFKAGHPGAPYRTRRRGNGGERVDIPRVILTLMVLAQSEPLARWLSSPGVEGEGVSARFLVVSPRSRVGWRDPDAPRMTPEAEAAFHVHLERLAALPPDTTIRLDPAAQSILNRWRRGVEERMRVGADLRGDAGWGSKLGGNVARIAALLHAGEASGEAVGEEHMARALYLGDCFIEHRLALMGVLKRSDAEARRDAILELADVWQEKSPQGFTVRDLLQTKRATLRKRPEVEAALAELVTEGALERVREPTGGRPTTRYKPQNKRNERLKSPGLHAPSEGFVSFERAPSRGEASSDEPPPPSDADRPGWLDEVEPPPGVLP